jgi:hypothetical protein
MVLDKRVISLAFVVTDGVTRAGRSPPFFRRDSGPGAQIGGTRFPTLLKDCEEFPGLPIWSAAEPAQASYRPRKCDMATKKASSKSTKKAIKKVDKAVKKAVAKGVPENVVEETVEQALSDDSEEDVPRHLR